MTDARELAACPSCGSHVVQEHNNDFCECSNLGCAYSAREKAHLALCARLKAGDEAILILGQLRAGEKETT